MSKSMLDLTVSLVDRRALDIDPYAGNSTDVSTHEGHFYSGMPPGLSVACVPYYLLAKAWLPFVATAEREAALDRRFRETGSAPRGRREKHLTIILLNLFICLFGCSVLAAAMAVMFHGALTVLYPELDERRRLVTTWLFTFGTMWFIYSPAIYHRVLSTALCFGAFLLVLLPEDRRPVLGRRGALFGLALGLAVATSYELILVAAVLVVYAHSHWRGRWSWGTTVVGAAFPLALLACYHSVCFGAPWATPYGKRIAGSVVPPLFEGTEGALFAHLRRLGGFFAGSRYGIFFYSPLLLLALPALKCLKRGDPCRGPARVAFAIFGLVFVFHFATGYDGLPGEFGFRMMIPAIPFLMLLVPLSYDWSYRRVVPILAAVSAVILAKGIMYGVHAGRPVGDERLGFFAEYIAFWRSYPEYIARYGFSNYTLANLKDHVWPEFSPWLMSAIHLAVLACVALLLWGFVWKRADSLERH